MALTTVSLETRPFHELQPNETFLQLDTLQNPGGPYLMQKTVPMPGRDNESEFNCRSVRPGREDKLFEEFYVAAVPDDELVLVIRC